jgi:uncharacterized protein (TIGR02996 family)
MDLEAAFLGAVHDNPLDDTPWLVLADYLEEQGDPRAELVRLNRLLREAPRGRQRRAGEQRVQELLAGGLAPCVPILTNSLGMRLALIGTGRFWMGSPAAEPGRYLDENGRHEVAITRPFYLGACQVTQEQYERLMGQNPSQFTLANAAERLPGQGTGNLPVERVSWGDAVRFCTLLSEWPEESAAGRVYRLPTEAEWEYACRAGIWGSPFHFGKSLSSTQANFDGEQPYGDAPAGPNLRRPAAMGSYRPNAWGLFDMHGNVWEWCADWFDANYYRRSPAIDPPGPEEGDGRVMRGGSWTSPGMNCRSAIRDRIQPPDIGSSIGFRVALTLARWGQPAR